MANHWDRILAEAEWILSSRPHVKMCSDARNQQALTANIPLSPRKKNWLLAHNSTEGNYSLLDAGKTPGEHVAPVPKRMPSASSI